jgi:peptide/nickel transport system permease protein
MVGMIARRLLLMIPMLLLMTFLVFGLVILIPGDAAVTLAGGLDAPPGAIEAVREEMHLDRPFLAQYGEWLGGVVHGDFGTSLYSHAPITDEMANRIPVSLGLVILILVLGLPIALLAGIAGGLRPGSLLDKVLLLGSSAAVSMPGFWVALVLVTIFAVKLGWLPPFGYTNFTDNPFEWFKGLIMPAASTALALSAIISRQVRGGLADVMQTPYIRTAWTKGGSTRRVVVGHALKNSAGPVVTVLGLQIGALLGATVIVEQIFSIPGLGSYLLNAVNVQDVPVIQAAAVFFVVLNMTVSLLVDITYGFLNPKVRTA